MTHMMEREWARQKAVAGVRSLLARVDLYTSANAAGSGIDRGCDNRRQGDACAVRHLN
jgi:hypothetical protein